MLIRRQNITHLPNPSDKYRIDLVCDRFDKLRPKMAEARFRAAALRTACHPDPDRSQAAIALARQLDPDGPGWTVPENPVCPIFMREQRWKITGAIWRKCGDYWRDDVFAFTLIPHGMIFQAGALHTANAIDLVERLRLRLERARKKAGVEGYDGFLFIGLHGEFDPGIDAYRLHFHGIGAGEAMREMVNALRKQKPFRSRRSDGGGGTKSDKPVRISRKVIKDLPRAISYTVQSFWPARWTGVDEQGKPLKQRGKHRIKEPHFSEYLMWLSQWQLQDLILMINLRVTRQGLRVAKKNAHK